MEERGRKSKNLRLFKSAGIELESNYDNISLAAKSYGAGVSFGGLSARTGGKGYGQRLKKNSDEAAATNEQTGG